MGELYAPVLPGSKVKEGATGAVASKGRPQAVALVSGSQADSLLHPLEQVRRILNVYAQRSR